MNKDTFIKEINKLGINLDEKKINSIEIYKNLLIEWNKKFNLTSIIKDDEIYLKHFYDSLCLYKTNLLKGNLKLCDFGTGAGFPGMVIAIIFNNINVTLVESNKKKCIFLEEIKTKLELNNVFIINDRMENYSKNNEEVFDIVTCRAVSQMGIILELAIKSLKVNGYFLPLKGNIDKENKNLEVLEKKYNCKLINIVKYNLPFEDSNRTIPVIKKEEKTNKRYPREYNKIKKEYSVL